MAIERAESSRSGEYQRGLGKRLEDFEQKVLSERQGERRVGAKVVGIVGLGGVGKTTLAQEFFNRWKSDYTGSSFLSGVRENVNRGNLTSLQSKLIRDLKGNIDIKIGTPEEGIGVLRKNLESCHGLVVLDDVDHVDQLEALLPMKDVLDPQSLVLVTSRDKHVLISAGIRESSIYMIGVFNIEHSQEIFCSYAFSQSSPPPGFEDLVIRFVESLKGMPLCLKAFGGLLRGENNIIQWKEVLNKVNGIVFHDHLIQKQLLICFKSLNEEEQQIFLDIACFSIGNDRDRWTDIWCESGWKGLEGFRNLENKGLVQVDIENKIGMHDHLSDLGRDIVTSIDNMPRRLWSATVHGLHDLLKRSSSVRGIIMAPGETLDQVRGIRMVPAKLAGFRLCNLHFLEAEGSLVESILRKVRSPKLMWLRWIDCPHSSLPSWLPMHNLRVLEVDGRELNELWQCESQAPMHLRELILKAPLSKLPKSLGQLKHLKKIVAEEAYLATLPEECLYLPSLKYLSLKDYKILPDSGGNFTNLQLTDDRSLENLSDSMANLTNLNLTDLERCTSLEMLLTAIVWRHFQNP